MLRKAIFSRLLVGTQHPQVPKVFKRDLDKEARRMFHDMKEAGDRTLQQLKDDAKYLYEEAGKRLPDWLR